MKPAPNTPGRRIASEIAATLPDVMVVQALRALRALRGLELRPDRPLLPLADPAQIEADMPAAPERPALGHGRAYAKWRAEVTRALARTRLPSRR